VHNWYVRYFVYSWVINSCRIYACVNMAFVLWICLGFQLIEVMIVTEYK